VGSERWSVGSEQWAENYAVKIRNYRELIAWQKAIGLVEDVYRASKGFPREETFGLTSQLRRAVISIPSNIAEGQSRKSSKEFLHHLSGAYGSLSEVETQLFIANKLGYMGGETHTELLGASAEIGRLINGLCNSISKRVAK
jgi:four helix bundle protein